MMTSCLHGAFLIVKLEVDSEQELSKQLLCSRGKHALGEEQKRFHPTEPEGNKQKEDFQFQMHIQASQVHYILLP